MTRARLFFGWFPSRPIAQCAVIVGFAVSLGSCGPIDSVQVQQDTDAHAPTFVSLNPCLDDILVNVAAPDQILALSHYSSDPSASSVGVEVAAQYGVTGGTAEEVLALEPDVVLASTFIAPTTRAAFERLGLRVETFGSPDTAEASIEQVRRLADLAKRPNAGDDLIQSIAAEPESQSSHQWSALLWQPGQIVPGDATLVADHLRWAGLSNNTSDRGLGQAAYVSLERLLADPPDILLVAGDRPGQRHPQLDQQSGMLVAEFDASLLYCGGPTIPKARERLIEIRSEFERDFKRAANS